MIISSGEPVIQSLSTLFWIRMRIVNLSYQKLMRMCRSDNVVRGSLNLVKFSRSPKCTTHGSWKITHDQGYLMDWVVQKWIIMHESWMSNQIWIIIHDVKLSHTWCKFKFLSKNIRFQPWFPWIIYDTYMHPWRSKFYNVIILLKLWINSQRDIVALKMLTDNK